MSDLKIAVIFGGQLRTGVETSKSIFNFLGEYLPNCDFFVHTWDITTYKRNDYHGSHSPTFDWDAIKLKEEYLNQFLEIYKPVKHEITPFLKFRKEVEDTKEFSGTHWMYSFWKVNELKKDYEKENRFKYDYVLKVRGDLCFRMDVFLREHINLLQKNENKMSIFLFEDMYYIATSEVIDELANMGHPTNGTFKNIDGFQNDLNRNIIKYIETTFNRIPQFHQSESGCDYFLLRNTAKHLPYEKMDEMVKIFNTYYENHDFNEKTI